MGIRGKLSRAESPYDRIWVTAFVHTGQRGPHSRSVVHLVPHVTLTEPARQSSQGGQGARKTQLYIYVGWVLHGEGPASVPIPQEGMLKDLQKSVEEEEQVWKTKVSATEEELKKVQPDLPQGPATQALLQGVHLPSEFKRNFRQTAGKSRGDHSGDSHIAGVW